MVQEAYHLETIFIVEKVLLYFEDVVLVQKHPKVYEVELAIVIKKAQIQTLIEALNLKSP